MHETNIDPVVERIARALCRDNCAEYHPTGGCKFEDRGCPANAWMLFIRPATVALEALRSLGDDVQGATQLIAHFSAYQGEMHTIDGEPVVPDELVAGMAAALGKSEG